MKTEEFISSLSEISQKNSYRFEQLRACVPLGRDDAGNVAVAHREENPERYHHVCVTGAGRGGFIRRLVVTLSCLYDRGEASFLVLSPHEEYGELLRLKAADVTVPFIRSSADYLAALDAVRELGADASFNGRNDLLIDGRKFSGNAQYRLGDCIVHHGSLLYDTNIEQMVASTTVDPYKILSKSIKSVRDRVTNISEHLPRRLSVEEFKSCMVRHLMRGSTDTYAVTPADDARIRQLAQEKFAAWDAIYGKNPRFNLERTDRFPGGKLTFRLDVQRGVIRSASVWGDFFSTLSAEAITGALTGCRYDRAAVLDALQKNGIDGAVYQISAADMAALIAD